MIPLKDVNPTRRTPVLTIGLIVVCTLVFLFQIAKPATARLGSEQAFICDYGLVADNLFSDGDPPADLCQELNAERSSYLTLLTSQFLHADWLHLIFNMLFLWVFGNNIEDRLGRIRFLPFYLLCGVAREPRPVGRRRRQPGAADRRLGGHIGDPRRLPGAVPAGARVDGGAAALLPALQAARLDLAC